MSNSVEMGMGTLTVPTSGMTLVGSPASSNTADNSVKTAGQPVQVMRLDLAPGVLNDLLKNAANNKRKIHISFGRAVTLHCGNKPHQLLAAAQTSQGELYSNSAGSNDELAFTGRLSHKLAMQQMKDNLAETDAAMAMLQSRMASHKKEKLAKQIHFVPDGQDLPPPVQMKAADIKILNERGPPKRMKDAATRSMPASPAITASGSAPKRTTPPTSQPYVNNPKASKLQALRTPLIHLLAVRPVSEKFLASKTGCTQEECLEVLHKIARSYFLDSTKWDLSDKGFKELDIWKFPYPTLEDRQFAVNRAVTAFDRMRLAREDNLWQMLLPQNERGQGKVISKLRLTTGATQYVAPPRINVQATGDAHREANEPGDGNDRKDRLGPTDAEPMARSKSHDAIKKTKISEKEALTKRLLSKNPKVSQVAKPRDAQPSTKKGTKKATASTNNIAKSAEFVHESDDEMKIEDVGAAPAKADEVPPSSSNGTKTSKPVSNGVPNVPAKAKTPVVKDSKIQKNTSVPAAAAPAAAPAVAKKPIAKKATAKSSAPARSPSTGTKKRISEASRTMTKSVSRQPTSASPFKPSPLGSSPPTNASDLENDGHTLHASSNSSTPLISQSRKVNGSTPLPPADQMRLAPKSAVDGSALLKRKANDIDSGIHDHVVSAANGQSHGSPKRQKTSMSPPTSNPSTGSSRSDSDSSTTNDERMMLARNFKTDYAIYERLYNEVYAWKDAPVDRVKEVLQMHQRLIAMKNEIAKIAKS